MLSPFMVAMAPETAAQQPQAPAAIYNWENQGEMNIVNEEDMRTGASGSFSYPPGGGGAQQVDDWHIC